MPGFDISNIPDGDQVEITDLGPQDDGSRSSLSLVLLKLVRKVPFLGNARTRFTMLAWLACVIMLLFLVQPALPNVPSQTPITSARDLQYPLAIISTTSSYNVTWVRVSNGKIIVVQASPGRVVWHHCKVQHWFIPPRYAHPIVVKCP